MQVAPIQVVHRYNTAAVWTTYNPILKAGEIGIESDTQCFKIGDGTHKWSELTYRLQNNSSLTYKTGPTMIITGNKLNANLRYEVWSVD